MSAGEVTIDLDMSKSAGYSMYLQNVEIGDESNTFSMLKKQADSLCRSVRGMKCLGRNRTCAGCR
jgi:hypothetical protein